MNLTSASNFKCIQRGLPSVFATFCHAFMTFQLIPSRFHGLYSSLTSVLRQIPVGAHLWCRRFFSILGYNPSGFCTCQQLWMYPERFTQRFCDILSRFHDIPADSRQLSWVLQQFDHRFETNSSRLSPLVQALLQHFWVQFQCLWHRPAILNALQRRLPSVFTTFCHAFRTFQPNPGRFHGFYSRLTTVLRQIPVGAHLWCRRFFSIFGCNSNAFGTGQQV